jgi:hypothetical protein
MGTTITFSIGQELTKKQAEWVTDFARRQIEDVLMRTDDGLAAEVDRWMHHAYLQRALSRDIWDGIPVDPEVWQLQFRNQLFRMMPALQALLFAWSNLSPEQRDLGMIDAAAREWPEIGSMKERLAALLADPMWSRKTAKSAVIDGYMILAEDFIDGIVINPACPPMRNIGLTYRNDFDKNFWLNRPFIYQDAPDGPYIVECLTYDGGKDPTQWVVCQDLSAALDAVGNRLNNPKPEKDLVDG